jgi:acyl carrier protein
MTRSRHEIQDWLIARVSNLTGIAAEEIDVSEPFYCYGLDSVVVVTLLADLQTWLGHRLRDNPLDDHTTLEALAVFLAEQTTADDNVTN